MADLALLTILKLYPTKNKPNKELARNACETALLGFFSVKFGFDVPDDHKSDCRALVR